jgi:hypothetical protein
VVLEKNGEDQLNRSCEKVRRITWNQRGKEYHTYIKKKGVSLDWSLLAWELLSKTRYRNTGREKVRSEGNTRKKT